MQITLLDPKGIPEAEKDLFESNGHSIRNKFVLPILNYYDENEKERRQVIIDKETSLKRSNVNED